MKASIAASAVLLPLALTGATCYAAGGQATGTITLYNLNGTIQNRGACVQMNPAVPNGWACIWRNNLLYPEISLMLLEARMQGKQCSLGWSTTDGSGYAMIDWAQC
jgi:hypothetical protein